MRVPAIVRACILILLVGAATTAAINYGYFKYNNVTDAPWWVGFLLQGFWELLFLPVLLGSYIFCARKLCVPKQTGLLSGALVGAAFPLLQIALGLVLHVAGEGYWILANLPLAVLLPYLALLLERRFAGQ